jgi:GT2 family glycosyltransferase
MSAGSPRASIVVPLTGIPTQALRCFEGLAAQCEHPGHEVIVVDDASVGLDSLLSRLDGDVEVVRSSRRLGFAAAARLGAQRARGDILVFVRGSSTPASGWLAPLVAALDDPAVGLAASATEGDLHMTPLAAWSVALRAQDLSRGAPGDPPEQLFFGELALSLATLGMRLEQCSDSRIRPPGSRTGGARRAPGEKPELTIVIPTLDATCDRVRACLKAVQSNTEIAHEIVIVDNGAPPQGFADPVNAGLRAARTPYVVVMNDDVEPLAGWWAPLRAALDAGAPVAFPLTVEGPMRDDFAAWCFAISADAIGEFGHAPGTFFDPTLVVWYQDTDLLLALRRAGRPPVLVRESRIRHGLSQTVASEDAELSAWVRVQVAADRQRFFAKHPGLRSAVTHK